MKKSTLILILPVFLALMVSPEISAQNDPVQDESEKNNSIGIKFGRIVSDLWFIGEDYSNEHPGELRTSCNWGISFDRNLSEYMMFNAELMYMKKGRGGQSSANYFHPWWPPNLNSPFEPIMIDHLVLASSIIYSTKGRIALYTGPGIYQAILLHSKSNITLGWAENPKPRRFDLGIGLKAGVSAPLHPSIIAKIEINGTSGIIPVFSKSEIKATSIEKYKGTIALNKTLAGNVSLSYRF